MADELLMLAKTAIGNEFELSPQQAARLRGATAQEMRDDAKTMRVELGLPPLDDGGRDRQSDERGRFAKQTDMNPLIREGVS